ncbi:MAG: S9 family peptidase [Paucibacter sp.]|nr:S9 family peptidase [Roseateles sp.]
MKLLASLLLSLAPLAGAMAAPTQHLFLEVRLSPDGSLVASVEGDAPPSGGFPVRRELILRSSDGSGERKLTMPCGDTPECWPASLAWSPDGKQLAFVLRTPGSHARSIYRATRDGKVEQLLAFDGTIKDLRYGDKGVLAMLATSGAQKEVGAVEAGAPISGELDAPTPSQRLAVLEPGASSLSFVSRDGLYVYEYDWVHGNRGFVATAAPGDGDRNWWIAKLYAFDGLKEVKERLLYAPRNAREQLADPKVSPDGTRTAFIVGLMSDFGSTGGDVMTVPTAGGAPLALTPDMAASASQLEWGCSGRLEAMVLAGDELQRLDLGEGRAALAPKLLWRSAESLRDLDSACAAKSSVSVRENFDKPAEIQVLRDGQWKDITRRNAELAKANFTARSLHWTSEGRNVQGWLLWPESPAPGQHPMVVDVHGGPAAAHRPHYVGNGVQRSLLGKGYAIFLPNPRGSFGQGEAFTQANAQDFGHGDLRDILAGVDEVIRTEAVDPQRLGIMGHSYGGYMTMWTVTQTVRFRAAVAGAGIVNWQSYYGQNGINEWMPPYFGATVYDDPAVYAKSSPINFIKNVRTPTLAYVGGADIECPPAQTQEFGTALHALGVPSSTVIYEGEGHRFRKPETTADIERRTIAWFERWLH